MAPVEPVDPKERRRAMAMRFEHEFTVPVPVEQAWSVLLDAERVAPCLPGATLDTVEGDTVKGRMRVKVGPITITYQGTATFENVDKDAHTLTLQASGKEARGSGTASATVTARMLAEGDHTKVRVETSFNVTGRPAQFGRGVMAEVGSKLIDRFAVNLATLLEEGTIRTRETVVSLTVTTPSATPEGETITSPNAVSPAAPSSDKISPAAASSNSVSATEEKPAGVEEEIRGERAGEEPETRQRHLSAVASETHPAGTSRTSRTPDEEALDLLEIAGAPVLKRLFPALGVLAVLCLAIYLIRRLFRK